MRNERLRLNCKYKAWTKGQKGHTHSVRTLPKMYSDKVVKYSSTKQRDRDRERESYGSAETNKERTEESAPRGKKFRPNIRPQQRPLPSLTFGLVFDQLLHLALLQRVHHVRQAALASLRGSHWARGRAAVAAGPSAASSLLFAR